MWISTYRLVSIAFLFAFCICGSAFNQAAAQDVLYQEEFNNGIQSTGGNPGGYQLQLGDTTLQITGNGTAGAYAALSYSFHNGGGSPILINAVSSPKIYIRARGTNSPNLRIDFQDEGGYLTNLNPATNILESDYTIYEYDLTNNLQDGGFGGPCTNAPCPVDASKFRSLIMFVNDASGGYNGNIEIDWISIGAPIEPIVRSAELDIRYNQVSYFTGRPKFISIASELPIVDLPYEIYRVGNTTPIMQGAIGSNGVWSSSNEHVASLNMSGITSEGAYRFEADGKSVEFTVSDSGYDDLSEASLKYYYFNRASQELTSQYAGQWERPAGHPDDRVLIHSSAASATRPTGTIISSPKGWYDAGDYNKYIVNSGISTYTLLAAYEHYPEYYQRFSLNIPEQGGELPDILDEVIWNLDWMMSMQDPADGGVYHKLTGLNFSGIVMPHQYNATRYVVQKSTAAALNFAAVAAVASRVFADFEQEKPGYSQQLLQASESAYAWAKANPTSYYVQPSDVRTGEYGDNNMRDEFDWAAVELYITTNESVYRQDFTESQIGNGIPAWPYSAPLALISLAHHADQLGGNVDLSTVRTRFMQTANQLRAFTLQSTMRVAMGSGSNDFVWGSNGQAGNQLVLLIRAYELTEDESFLDAAYVAMDYLLGRNGTGYCYVSGFGDQSPIRPHHRPSEADNVVDPVPGMVAGGPNPGRQDGCPNYFGTTPAASYVDSWCSYASNEVTINWNAPLAYAVNALRFYAKGLPSSIRDPKAPQKPKLGLVPNPGVGLLTFPDFDSQLSNSLKVTDLSGRIVHFTEQLQDPFVDLSHLPAGSYVVTLSHPNGERSSVWLKQ